MSDLTSAIVSGGYQEPVELIVVDDGSAEPIKIPDFKVAVSLYRLPKNSGAPRARALGFGKSSGEFVHFHDSDDGFGEGWLAGIIGELQDNPELDVLLTGRNDISREGSRYRYQTFFHRHADQPERIRQRLVYRNCMGPLGGVTFARRVIEQIEFRNFLSCQDWQMYLDAMEHATILKSRADISYCFNVSGDDRISHNPAKKLIGHLQLSRLTAGKSVFGRNIRLFYLMTCKRHIMSKQGVMLFFYRKRRFRLWFCYLLASIYWRLH